MTDATSDLITLTEGSATVLNKKGQVFYNPIQQFNRDISVVAIKQFIATRSKSPHISKKPPNPKGIDILEALSATGLRSIRYFKEIPGINSIIVNDMDPTAVEAIKRNLEYNNIDLTTCIPTQSDAKELMYQHAFKDEQRFDVIDLDPYGSATIFLDAAIQSIDNGGLLCVTCTDSAVLCGSHTDQLWSQYQVAAMKGRHCHEFALRVILKELNGHAARYKKAIEPLISLSVDFYCRIFVRVFDSPVETKGAFSKIGMTYQCITCTSYWSSPFGRVESVKQTPLFKSQTSMPVGNQCPHCNSKVKIGGPLWLGPLHSPDFLDAAIEHLKQNESAKLYATHTRMLGLLSVCREELPQSPLFYTVGGLCAVLKLSQPTLLGLRSALISAGYQVSGTHCISDPAFKTDAPNEVIWDIFRSWNLIQKTPKNLQKLAADSAAYKILSVAPKITADFTHRPDAQPSSRDLPRYIRNPGQGPLPRAKGKRSNEDAENNESQKKQKLDGEGTEQIE